MQNIKLTFIAVLVIFLVTGAVFYFNPKKSPLAPVQTPLPTPTAQNGTLDNDSIMLKVSDFYKQYEGCLKNPPPEAAGKVSKYCQDNNPSISSNFSKNLENGGIVSAGADPVFCAQNIPQKINVEKADGQNETGTAMVTEAFGSNNVIVTVNLAKTGEEWLINNIICPQP